MNNNHKNRGEKMIKLIAVDMDGTLLNNEKHIAEAQREALKKAASAGIKVVLCTGRPLFGVLPLYKELDLSSNEGYAILNNGCEIRKTENWTLVRSFELTGKEIFYLHSLVKDYDIDFTLSDDKHYFCVGKKPNKYTIRDGELVYVPITEITLEEAMSGKYRMFKAMYVGDMDELTKFQENLPKDINKFYSICRSQKIILEAMPVGADKGKTLKFLVEQLGIERSEVMAIGDGNNDVEMLGYAGIGVAMANGTEAAKNSAKYITDTNENDGVAKAIYKYVFE
jgi:cof-like hydrolase